MNSGQTTSTRMLNALVIEDDQEDFELLTDGLRRAGFHADCRRVETETDFVAQLKPGIDVVLCDYSLPGWTAIRALELFRASHLDVPFIVISGAISEEVAVDCMKQGASDYLLKDRLGRLGPAITRAISEVAERRLTESLSGRLLKAQEEERKSIARELHDQIGQGMVVLLMELHKLEAELANQGPAQSRIKGIVQLVQSHEATVHDIGLLLRPYMLDELGLMPALQWHSREVSLRTGMQVTVEGDAECNRLSEDYRTCIFRVVQETLHNAVRHAHATRAKVTVRQDPSHVRVKVQDDGCGCDARYAKGKGILEMEARAKDLGGECHFVSKPGRGARVSMLLPLTAALAGHAQYAAIGSAGGARA